LARTSVTPAGGRGAAVAGEVDGQQAGVPGEQRGSADQFAHDPPSPWTNTTSGPAGVPPKST
jgi:hypothetical protein